MSAAESQPMVVLSAPTCAGKSTLADHLVQHTSLSFATSATTRQPRSNETPGQDYYFLEDDDFHDLIGSDKLIEYETVHGDYYGTLTSELTKPQPTLLDIDVRGALTVKERFEHALLIFIAPPSLDVIENRLRRREEHDQADIQRRLRRANDEMAYQDRFDEVIVNDELNEAKRRIRSLVSPCLGEGKNA